MRHALLAAGLLVSACGAPGAASNARGVPSSSIDGENVTRAPLMTRGAPPSTMVSVPAGTFLVGRDGDAASEGPVIRVTLNAFEIDVTEVTLAQYEACVLAGACPPPAAETGPGGVGTKAEQDHVSSFCNGGKPDRANHPINCVTHDEATRYCRWAGKRLPTEDEWEAAARGPEGRRFPWGDAAASGNICQNTTRRYVTTCAVGQSPAGRSPYGALDMMGNVSEWTASLKTRDRAHAPEPGTTAYVKRGGEWLAIFPNFAITFRRFSGGESRSPDDGFRCAR